MQREISRRKVELSIKQLKKLSTKDLHGHIEELQGHIAEAIQREKQIQGHQKGEEAVHQELTHKIGRLETKLSRYLQTQEARKGRIQELEDKIRSKFETKREKIAALKEDLARLIKLYNYTKKAKAPKTHLLRVAKRIEQVKNKISLLK
jgi:chaperonin cofactor prefoldin